MMELKGVVRGDHHRKSRELNRDLIERSRNVSKEKKQYKLRLLVKIDQKYELEIYYTR